MKNFSWRVLDGLALMWRGLVLAVALTLLATGLWLGITEDRDALMLVIVVPMWLYWKWTEDWRN